MSCTEQDGGAADVAIVDESVSRQGWQPLDADLIRRLSLPRDLSGRHTTSSGAAWSVRPAVNTPSALVLSLSGAGRGTVRPAGQPASERARTWSPVPPSAFVSIGRLSGRVSAVQPEDRSALGLPGANDNFFSPAAASRRSMWRDLFFLAVLAATVAGAFLSGRVHGFQKVIVVPGPSSFYSVVT